MSALKRAKYPGYEVYDISPSRPPEGFHYSPPKELTNMTVDQLLKHADQVLERADQALMETEES